MKVVFSLFLIFSFLVLLPSPTYAIDQIINMTSSGFEPAEIVVSEGSTVTFINIDTSEHWPASNVHPTHEIYPQFDPKKPIESNGSWSFKPKVGEWKFHDHLFPHMRGVIKVSFESGVNGKIVSIKDWVLGLFNKFRTYFISLSSLKKAKMDKVLPVESFKKLSPTEQFDALRKIADENSGERAWQYIKDAFKGEAASSGNIHDLAHLSGSLIYQKSGFNGLKNCSAEFSFGCYHGFLDKAFEKNLDHLLDAESSCMKLGKGMSGPVASCIHGIGHGVASFYATADLNSSLSSCRKLTQGREYCFDGVFMEFVRSAPEVFYKKEDPLYPCNSLEKDYGYIYSFACGRNQPAALMSRLKKGFDEVVNICLSSSSTPFKQACFDSLGFSLASTADVEKIVSGCRQIGITEYVLRCIKSAAGELVFQEVPDWNDKYQLVCNSLNEGKEECLEYVKRLIKDYNRAVSVNFPPKKDAEDINSYIREQLKKCYGIGGRDGCYKQLADVLYAQFGLKNTLQVLADNENYPEVYARCHEVTHYLSRLEYQKVGSISKVYAQCDSTCHGGCYHGTLEAYLNEHREDLSPGGFSKICGNGSDYQKPLEFNECLHGLGHAAMFVYDMELKDSLKLCDSLHDQDSKERCYSGVFMENSSSSTSFDHQSKYIKATDPFYPCNVLEEKYLPLCWQYQSSYFSIINNQDWIKVAKMCQQIPDKYQDKCFITIGTNQVGFTQSLKTMKDDCDLMPSEDFKDRCISGVVSSLSYRFVGDSKKMRDFCQLVDFQKKEICYRQIGTSLLDWDKNKETARNECAKITGQQSSSWCMDSIL